MYFGEKTLGEKLLDFRIKNGMTLREVSSMTGIAYNHLSLIEHGRVTKLQPKTIKKLTDLFESNGKEGQEN